MNVLTFTRANDSANESTNRVLSELAPQVRHWVYRHIGPGPDLDDATQEALIQIADALDRFEGRSKITTYARRIAVRAATRYRKRHWRGGQELELVHVEDARDPESIAMQRESLRRLYRTLDAIGVKLRTAFILCDIERLSHADAAELEDVSLETMRARLKRSRAELRRRLSADPYLAPLFEEAGR